MPAGAIAVDQHPTRHRQPQLAARFKSEHVVAVSRNIENALDGTGKRVAPHVGKVKRLVCVESLECLVAPKVGPGIRQVERHMPGIRFPVRSAIGRQRRPTLEAVRDDAIENTAIREQLDLGVLRGPKSGVPRQPLAMRPYQT